MPTDTLSLVPVGMFDGLGVDAPKRLEELPALRKLLPISRKQSIEALYKFASIVKPQRKKRNGFLSEEQPNLKLVQKLEEKFFELQDKFFD